MTKQPRHTLKRKKRQWFEGEIRRLLDRLYGTALQLTGDPDDAEDTVAEAVTKAWTKLDQLHDPEQFEGWVFRILNNTFISQWRRRRSRQNHETPFDEDDNDSTSFSLFQKMHQPFLLWWGTPETSFVNQLLQDDIHRALKRLPEEYRLVVVLVDIEGYTYEESAEYLDIPKGTVRSRLNRARGKLQKALWQQACDAGFKHATPTGRGKS